MVQTLDCVECGTLLRTSPRLAPGKKARCLSCKKIFLVGINNRLLPETSSLATDELIGQDDDEGGGGGGWGSKKDDDDADGGKGDGEEEEEVEEDDGKGGKRKVKRKVPGKKSGGFFSGLMSYVIGGVLLLSLCCCVVILQQLGFITGTPEYIGTWLKASGPADDAPLEKKLVITKTDAKSGTGTYTVYTEEDDPTKPGEKKAGLDKVMPFKYTVPEDTKVKKITLTMDDPKNEFWTGKNTGEFTYVAGTGNGSTLVLTPVAGGDAITFTREPVATASSPAKTRKTK
jgi:hypothetical protein